MNAGCKPTEAVPQLLGLFVKQLFLLSLSSLFSDNFCGVWIGLTSLRDYKILVSPFTLFSLFNLITSVECGVD